MLCREGDIGWRVKRRGSKSILENGGRERGGGRGRYYWGYVTIVTER